MVNPGGFEAGIVVPSGGDGITFSTSGAVYLRGLTIEGNGVGQRGIFYSGVAGSLTIQQCVVGPAQAIGVQEVSNIRHASDHARTLPGTGLLTYLKKYSVLPALTAQSALRPEGSSDGGFAQPIHAGIAAPPRRVAQRP
jgi:hypothetical protein